MNQRGNAFFIILLCIVAFVALSLAATSSMKGGSKTASAEKAQLTQGETDNCTTQIDNALSHLQIINGCEESEISYELPGGGNVNPDAPADKHCHVFFAEGAGAIPCGGYTEISHPVSPVGTITYGDTTSWVRVGSSGTYFQCQNWDSGCDYFAFTMDGSTFPSSICLTKTSYGGDPHADPWADNFFDEMCNSACGGISTSNPPPDPNSASHYIEDDYSLTPYTGSCWNRFSMAGGSQLECSCF